MSPEESGLFEEHASYFARFASKVTILKIGTKSLQLHGVARQKLLSSCEQLSAYCVDIAGDGIWVDIVGGKDSQVHPNKL